MTIHKYKVYVVTGKFMVRIPEGARFLDVQMQGGHAQMWFSLHPSNQHECRTFEAHGTGDDIPDDGRQYLGTFQDGPFVWHLFEVIR